MPKSNPVQIGSFEFDPDRGVLRDASGAEATLRPQTRQVLRVLVEAEGELVDKDHLMDVVWPDTHVTDDSLVQCVSEIRKALGPEDAKLLATIPKQGYRLSADIEAELSIQEVLGSAFKAKYSGAVKRMGYVARTVIALALLLSFGVIVYSVSREKAPAEHVTIAVLPFENLSGNEEQDYLSSGLAEDLLTDLSRIGDMKVLSRSATFGLRNSSENPSAIAEKLGANFLIDGSVQRDGGRIRISVQLVQLSAGANIWAERYDRQLGDLFEVQDDVRKKIVDGLAVKLAPQEKERLFSANTVNVTAYDLLLRGRHHEASLARDGVLEAISHYRRAIEIEPSYAEAYARLANMYDFSSRFGWGENSEADRILALEMAEQSVRFDPQSPFAHWTLARVLSRLGTDPSSRDRAIVELRKAIDLDPNYADAYAFISLIYAGKGDSDKAREAIAKAFDLNPTPPAWYYQNRGVYSYLEEHYDTAANDFYVAVEQNPTAAFSRLWLAAANAMAGNIDDAEWEIEEALALGEPHTVSKVLRSNPIIEDPRFKESYATGLIAAGLPE